MSATFAFFPRRRFLPLFITQFLGAFNDNLLKTAFLVMVSYAGLGFAGLPAAQIVNLASGLFILPFFLFSATAGRLAERLDKARIARWVKLSELGIMLLAAVGFYTRNVPLLLLALFLMGVHSTFFGPIKYAMLPQHLRRDELLGGNGLIEMGTFIAILLGQMAGSLLVGQPVWVTVALLGAKPVYVDIDEQTYNIDPAKIEAAITDKTKAIIPVSLYGQCADFDAINAIAAKHKLPVIEDAAQSFGAIYKGTKSGNLSTIACTSFFPSKPLGCYGDGGAIFTNDEQLATVIRQTARHGQDRRYHHIRIGVNSRLDTLQAAILLPKLAILEEEMQLRQKVAQMYTTALQAAGLAAPFIEPHNRSAYAQFTIRIKNRAAVQTALKEDSNQSRGEMVLILHPAQVEKHSDMPEAAQQVMKILAADLPTKQAADLAAKITGESKKALYDLALTWKA